MTNSEPLNNPDDTELDDDFDAEGAVIKYREVMAQLGDATTEADKENLYQLATRLRHEWEVWQGEDSLDEMAFGEPWEE